MKEEIYITKSELQNNNELALKFGTRYILVDRIEDDVIEKSRFLQCSFTVLGFNKLRLFLSIEGSPTYHEGLFTLYAIYESMEEVVEKESIYEIESAIGLPQHHEMTIQVLEEIQGSNGSELLKKIEKHRDRLTTLVKHHLLNRAISKDSTF
ncbi:hypothetical protein ACFX4N_24555 [Priestia sp. YIM B13551]|uniref:hypothetical protein n=1 Tax=Priestia sp. YIM B13551 TaxID=3366306 RepID=UPI003670AD24